MGGGGLHTHNRVKPTLLVKVELGFDNTLKANQLLGISTECIYIPRPDWSQPKADLSQVIHIFKQVFI